MFSYLRAQFMFPLFALAFTSACGASKHEAADSGANLASAYLATPQQTSRPWTKFVLYYGEVANWSGDMSSLPLKAEYDSAQLERGSIVLSLNEAIGKRFAFGFELRNESDEIVATTDPVDRFNELDEETLSKCLVTIQTINPGRNFVEIAACDLFQAGGIVSTGNASVEIRPKVVQQDMVSPLPVALEYVGMDSEGTRTLKMSHSLDQTGIAHIEVTVTAEGASGNDTFYDDSREPNMSGASTIVSEVPMKAGTYRIVMLSIEDGAGNIVHFVPDASGEKLEGTDIPATLTIPEM